jgi:hypothetical protein
VVLFGGDVHLNATGDGVVADEFLKVLRGDAHAGVSL